MGVDATISRNEECRRVKMMKNASKISKKDEGVCILDPSSEHSSGD
jgi:hypothetical protein